MGSDSNHNRHDTRYTHLPVMFRDEYNDKTYGTIVLEGEMTEDQHAELNRYLLRGNEYRPAVLDLIGLVLNRTDDEWFEMNLTEMKIEASDQPRWGGELDEYLPASIEEFIACFKAAAQRRWRLPGTLHVEIDATIDDGWLATVPALESVIARVEEQLAAGNMPDLRCTVVKTPEGQPIGCAWVTD
ncbi:hypothetical protein F0Q45_10250 [Mycobacterium simiae]|uniref:Uncharacterized protein n=1 Tax=Mycobacterium simiae TaxID=1784 RepID=A0A5B1BQJ8_MYCSI|nr:hypothetical protein [Mycobacterium simiae]KAA1250311.1 hypothetical protein F0Q45_10250 [Mycobacterium simiae]